LALATDFSIVVPLSSRPDYGRRDDNWAWNERRWRQLFPDHELIIESPANGSFNHPAAINAGVRRARSDIIVQADSDCFIDPLWVVQAVQAVDADAARWVLPERYGQLTARSSSRVLKVPPDTPLFDVEFDWWGKGSWAGVVVYPRDGFVGYPEEFTEYGPDDVCFGTAMDTLWGQHTRMAGTVWHLWHPRSSKAEHGHEIMRAYEAAAGDQEAMRKLVAR
jgi:glycosyltransferase involved in cell wall biosynthesis